MGKQALVAQRDWRKIVYAFALAVALTSITLLAANVPGPIGSLFVETAYADGCPSGGTCG